MPGHRIFFRLEAFTSDSSMTEEEFKGVIAKKLFEAEQELNAFSRLWFHIHEFVPNVQADFEAGVEFGVRCSEKGMNLQAALDEARD